MPDSRDQYVAVRCDKVTQNIGTTTEFGGPFLEFRSRRADARIVGNFIGRLKNNQGYPLRRGRADWRKEIIEPATSSRASGCQISVDTRCDSLGPDRRARSAHVHAILPAYRPGTSLSARDQSPATRRRRIPQPDNRQSTARCDVPLLRPQFQEHQARRQ